MHLRNLLYFLLNTESILFIIHTITAEIGSFYKFKTFTNNRQLYIQNFCVGGILPLIF